jgi:hypothetical protein
VEMVVSLSTMASSEVEYDDYSLLVSRWTCRVVFITLQVFISPFGPECCFYCCSGFGVGEVKVTLMLFTPLFGKLRSAFSFPQKDRVGISEYHYFHLVLFLCFSRLHFFRILYYLLLNLYLVTDTETNVILLF